MSELLAFAGRHAYLALALAGLTLALVYNELSGLFAGYRRIAPAGLTGLVNRDNALVVDLRPMAEFEKGHIPGAKNVLPSQFDPENKQLAAARALPVVLVCKTGQGAGDAARRLLKAGFEKVYVLEGGIQAWQQADLPLARGRA
jgi:rhodanese-related sulfurtransferase